MMINSGAVKYIYLFLALLWMSFIFMLSATPNLQTGLELFWDMVLRKIGHVAVYAILTILWFKFFSQAGVSKNKSLATSTLIAFAWAITDEWNQSFVAGRNGSFVDVMIDGIGILLVSTYFKVKSRPRR